MKINKTILLTIILFFTVSTTGLPLFIHLCKTMQEVSFDSCSMCKSHKSAEKVSFSRVNDCCDSKEAVTPISEKYILSKDSKDIVNVFGSVILLDNIVVNDQQHYVRYYAVLDNSPPGAISNSLYLDNSILLI